MGKSYRMVEQSIIMVYGLIVNVIIRMNMVGQESITKLCTGENNLFTIFEII